MRMEIVRGMSVPITTCVKVCLLSTILDHAISGVSRKRNIKEGVLGKR